MTKVVGTLAQMGCRQCKHLRVHSAEDAYDARYVYCAALPRLHCFERDMKYRCRGNLFEPRDENESEREKKYIHSSTQ